jgi:hypothetical protein
MEGWEMDEEEAENAKIVPGKPLGAVLTFFPLHPVLKHLAISTSACSAISVVKLF